MSDARNSCAYRRAIADLGRFRLLRYTMFPPGDLRRPVFEVAATRRGGSFLAEAAGVHRYPGPYEIGVLCASPIDNPVSRAGRVEVLATFEDGAGRLVLKIERSINQAVHVWWDGPLRNGFGLARYAVPAQLPVRSQMRCTVQVLDADVALAHYRPIKFYSRGILAN